MWINYDTQRLDFTMSELKLYPTYKRGQNNISIIDVIKCNQWLLNKSSMVFLTKNK